MEETILTVPEAAEYLGVTRRFVYQLIDQKELGCYRVGTGRIIRIGTSHLLEYLKYHEVPHEHERVEETA